jgi:hypothetical protein
MSNECGCQCGQARGACATEFQYAVKLVCGEVVAPGGVPTAVAPGHYWTAINIHNPDKCKDAHFRWKVAVAPAAVMVPPGPPEQGPVSPFQRPLTLHPDAALEIDCPHVMQVAFTLNPPPVSKFVKGYVVIESDIELDVVAVYTGAPSGANSMLTTFHTERVQPRCVPVCEDLVLPLHTGIAAWQTVASTVPGPLGPVVPVNPIPSAMAAPPFGSQFVSQLITDGASAPGNNSIRSYQLCFPLCFGFQAPATFPIQVLADDTAAVYLNGNPVSPVAAYNQLTLISVPTNSLHAGTNCIRVDVTNIPSGPNPTVFALAGILSVARGKCPCVPLPMVGI